MKFIYWFTEPRWSVSDIIGFLIGVKIGLEIVEALA